MTVRQVLCVIAFALAPCIAGAADGPKKCTVQDATAAETQAPAKSWDELYQSYRRYSQCDDGSVAEVFSNSVAQLLATHWEELDDLTKLASAHPSFANFVLRHTDVTMSLDQALAIKANASDKCPQASKNFCGRILLRMNEFK